MTVMLHSSSFCTHLMLGREGQEDGQTYSKAVNDAFAALEGGNATDEAFLRS